MLAFGAIIDQSLAPLPPDMTPRMQCALPAIQGRVTMVVDEEVGLVHLADSRPLSFDADLPLRDGRLVVAGTLRIDARAALRAQLALPNADDETAESDARLVALAYRRWRDRLAEHLIGDYALAVWDRAERRLVLATDPHGNRQLFWGRVGSLIIVSSEIDAVRALPGLSAELHEPTIVGLLRDGWIEDAERTVFRNVHRVPGGHTLVLDAGAQPVVRRHWDWPVPSPIRYRKDDDYLEHFTEILHATLRDRLRADSATVLLSGGMDSTTLAVAARRAAPQVRLHALTTTNPGMAPTDDAALSVQVARRLGMDHHVLDLDSFDDLAYIDTPDSLLPQPYDESDVDAYRRVFGVAAAAAPVALYGEDGDMLLQAPTLLGQLRTQPFGEVVASWTRRWWRSGHRPWVGLEWRQRLARLRHGGEPDRTPWLRADVLRAMAVPRRERPVHPLRPQAVSALSSPLWDAQYAVMAPTVSRASVLYTLPLVDPRLLAFVFAIPPVPWCQNKSLFREAMRNDLPAAVLARPKTALVGRIESGVARWRARGGAMDPVSERMARWVDIDAVRDIYRSGTPFQVMDSWRVLVIDRWLAREEARRA